MTASSRWRSSAVVKPTMHSLRGSEPTALEAIGCEWRYALLVMQPKMMMMMIALEVHLENCHACCQEFMKLKL